MDLLKIANELAEEFDADVAIYNGEVSMEAAIEVTKGVNGRSRRQNLVLVLVTYDGDPAAAYRIGRIVQSRYERFTLFASGFCKSAGTLIATGAHELVMSDFGELGPLDVQMSKKDELWEVQSGLTVMDTLTTLQQKALTACESFFLALSAKSGGTITLKTATDIATAMTTGLFTPLYSQMDPLILGEAGRAMRIAESYGSQLLKGGKNLSQDSLNQMLHGYPSHDFVIDRREAEGLFENVRPPKEAESRLAEALGDYAIFVDTEADAPFSFLSTESLCQNKTASKGATGGQHATIHGEEKEPEANGTIEEEGVELGEHGGGEAEDFVEEAIAFAHGGE